MQHNLLSRDRSHKKKYRQIWNDSPVLQEALEPRLLLSADVLTYHNDNARTGQNLDETLLTPTNVNAFTFGKVGQVAVDGAIFAQPLYKSNVNIPGLGLRNVVYVATEHDGVYAFDADTMAPLWYDSFVNPAMGITPVTPDDVKADNIKPEIGITGTPVIDPVTNTLFVVTKAKMATPKGPLFFQELQALDLATGAERPGGPVVIQATMRGRGDGSVRNRVSFNALTALQRSALLLVNGVVYVTFASHGDNGPFHGWMLGYNAQTLQPVSLFNDTPNGSDGGIWMGGSGPAADQAGRIFLSTGNGTFNSRGRQYGDTVLNLSPQGFGLRVNDSFTPANQAVQQAQDLDLGSGGVVLLPDQPGPHPQEIVAGGKDGTIYLIDRNNMGRYNRRGDRIVQELPGALSGVFDTPAYFNKTLYYVGLPFGSKGAPVMNTLEAMHLVNGQIAGPPTFGAFSYGYPGATPSISANGFTNGIVWTIDPNASQGGSAILRAYDASNVAVELYDSNQAGTRDLPGPGVSFAVPTVANGRVFVGGKNVLTVYGLLPPS